MGVKVGVGGWNAVSSSKAGTQPVPSEKAPVTLVLTLVLPGSVQLWLLSSLLILDIALKERLPYMCVGIWTYYSASLA